MNEFYTPAICLMSWYSCGFIALIVLIIHDRIIFGKFGRIEPGLWLFVIALGLLGLWLSISEAIKEIKRRKRK